MIESKYRITEEEEKKKRKQLLISKVGYKKAHDLYEAPLRHYDPIQYAVIKATEQLEIR